MITTFFVFGLCALLYFARLLTRFVKNENDWNPVSDAMIASQFPQRISDSGQLMAFHPHDLDFFNFQTDERVEAPLSIVSPSWRYVYPYDCLSPPNQTRCFMM